MSIMEWANDLILNLIDLYRERPCLWDPKDNNYKLLSKKGDAWKEIAERLKCDIITVKKKMESLLSSFRRERQRQITPSGAGADECYRSSWFAFKSMSFLMDKYTPRSTQDTVNRENIHTSLDDNSNTIDDGPAVIVGDEEVIAVPPSTEETPQRKTILSRKRKVVEDPRIETAYKLLQQTVSNKTPKDQSATFGEHVAMKHRNYNTYTKSIVEHLILNILFEADMGKFNNTSSTQLHSPLPYTPSQSPLMSPSSHSQQTTAHSASSHSHSPSQSEYHSYASTSSTSPLTLFISNFKE